MLAFPQNRRLADTRGEEPSRQIKELCGRSGPRRSFCRLESIFSVCVSRDMQKKTTSPRYLEWEKKLIRMRQVYISLFIAQ